MLEVLPFRPREDVLWDSRREPIGQGRRVDRDRNDRAKGPYGAAQSAGGADLLLRPKWECRSGNGLALHHTDEQGARRDQAHGEVHVQWIRSTSHQQRRRDCHAKDDTWLRSNHCTHRTASDLAKDKTHGHQARERPLSIR